MKKSEKSKADLIRKYAAKGQLASEIRKNVLKTFKTCYYSEVTRVVAAMA